MMSFRRRAFPEVLDNLLTAITKGVAAETQPFPPPGTDRPPYRHSLQQPPVSDIVSVYGSRNGQPHLFRKDVDYKLLSDRQVMEWQEGAELPDPGTLLQVNYYPQSAQPVLTDIYTGSVVRTLAESVALEIARLYAQLEIVYESAYIDTATGKALDNVVALLGIERISGGRPAGQVEFTRSPGSRGTIYIPTGTRVITADGEIEYETTDSVTLAEGQDTIRVVARDLEVNDPLAADLLTVLPVPIAGIASVTNPAPTAITTQDETDAELRARAKSFLHGSERATLGAIKEAIVRQGVAADVEEVADTPGWIEITPHAESLSPELHRRLTKAIADTRPAGVLVKPITLQPPVKVNMELRLTTAADLIEQELRAAQRTVRTKIEDYLARLPAADAGSINRVVGLVLGVPEIQDVRILSATRQDTGADVLDRDAGQISVAGVPTVLGELRITDPNLPTLLSVTVSYPEGEEQPQRAEIETQINQALTYLNGVNASETTDPPRRALSFGKLLYVIPLPGKAPASLETYDDAAASGSAPALPDGTAVSPYQVQFVFTSESGLSRILAQASDTYTLAPFERLSLSSVEIEPEAGDA
jgi:hypothetical protein